MEIFKGYQDSYEKLCDRALSYHRFYFSMISVLTASFVGVVSVDFHVVYKLVVCIFISMFSAFVGVVWYSTANSLRTKAEIKEILLVEKSAELGNDVYALESEMFRQRKSKDKILGTVWEYDKVLLRGLVLGFVGIYFTLFLQLWKLIKAS